MGDLAFIRERVPDWRHLNPISSANAAKLAEEYPGLPEDYLEILTTLGYGALGILQLYSGPVRPRTIYPNSVDALYTILLVGDDTQGYCFGFDTARAFSVVEVGPHGLLEPGSYPTITEFLREHIR
jgi:hypothetical protein